MDTNSLQNSEIYKSHLDNSSVEILSNYLEIIQEYMKQSIDKIYIRNQSYYKYVIYKGIDTMSHVFKILLLYTRNLEITQYYCKKSFLYYIEFMEQISDDNHSFLKLNSKDATLFVYKKTIFEINNDYKKDFQVCEQDAGIITNVEILIDMYNIFLKYIINNYDFDSFDKKTILKKIDSTLIKCFQIMTSLLLCQSENEYSIKLKLINYFYEILISKMIDLKHDIIPYIENLLRKLKNNIIDIDTIKSNVLCDDHDNKLKTLTPLRYINWLTHR